MPRRWADAALRAALFLSFYLASIGLLHGHGVFRQAVLWLPTGVAVAGLWLLGSRYWPVIALGTLVHRLVAGYTFPSYLPALFGNTLEALAAVTLLGRLGFRQEMRRLQDGLALLAVSALAPVVSATVGRTIWFTRPDELSFFAGWAGWWRMNALGILVVVPFVLSWATGPRPRPRLRTLAEVLALTGVALGLIGFLVSVESATNESGIVLSYLALPVTMYAAVRFGVRGAATASAAVMILLTLGTAYGFGLFVVPAATGTPAGARELALQAVIAIVTATPLLLGAVLAERETALAGIVRLEDQLRQTQKLEALGKLAGGVAHDFNNLLTVIGGHAELLRRSSGGDAEACAHAQAVADATTRAARLTNQLLAYSRRQMLEPEVLDLGQVVDQLGGMLRRLIGEDVEFVFQRSPERLFVRVDRGQLEQVILNLVVNARDAMPTGGTVVLATTPLEAREVAAAGCSGAEAPEGPLVCLSVRDTGVGMDADVVRQAFDPFFTTKERGKGTGLGLSTVYGIVRQSGGAVWIESAPRAGTTVRVCLPRVPEVAARSEDAAALAAALPGRGTVLVVEDEAQVRELVSRSLQEAGFTVLVAEDGRQGLELARRAAPPPDLVVTDAVMPHMGGRELIARLAAERPGLRALLVSGYAGEEPDPADPPGAEVAFLAKPFTPSALLARVRDCLAGPPATPPRPAPPGA